MQKAFLTICACLMIIAIHAQQLNHPVGLSANSGGVAATPDRYGRPTPDSRAWTDPALNHNRLLQQKDGEGTLVAVGGFKVKGSPFLYGGLKNGHIYSEKEKAWNILVNYNIYNQELEFFSTSNREQSLVKEPGDLDSFIITKSTDGIDHDLKFIYGRILGAKEKLYFLEIFKGQKFSVYKAYSSKLGFVSSNYSQPDLRQFDLEYDYYYSVEGKGVKKLKTNAASIVKALIEYKDLNNVLTSEAFSINEEEALKNAFRALNQ